MSGASAVASARRRRAEPTPQTITPTTSSTSNISQPARNDDDSQKQPVTPLQILQAHDLKIKELETTLESKVVEISKAVLEENLKHLKLNNIPSVSSNDSSLEKRIDKLTENLEELKMLVIKNQTLGLETNGEMLKLQKDTTDLKDKVSLLETGNNYNEKIIERITSIEESISELECLIKEDENEEDNLFNLGEGNTAEMLLRSMMQGSYNMATNEKDEEVVHKLNIHDNESDASNDIGDISELTLTESDLNTIKDEIKNELQEEKVSLENFSEEKLEKDTLIEVSDNEANE